MPGYLPDPPQIPVAGMGPHSTPQVTNSPSWNNPAAIANGISSFAQNYMLMQKQKQQEATARIKDTIQLAQMGIPIDDKQLVKDIKTSKLPIALDPESARTFTAPQAPNTPPSSVAPPPDPQSMMLAQGSGTNPLAALPPGVVPQPTAPGVMGPANPATAQVPVAPPSNLSTPQTMGPNPMMDPSVIAASARPGPSYLQSQPMPQTLRGFLSSLQQQGWDERQMKAGMNGILKGALQDDPKALEMASRLGLMKTLGAHDELFLMANKLYPDKTPAEAQAAVGKMLLYDIMGGPQKEMKLMETAKGMLPYFNNDLGAAQTYVNDVYNGKRPSVMPQMSFDQFKDIVGMTSKMQEQFPTSGNLPQLAATFMMGGRVQDAQQIMAAMAQHYPTSAQLELQMKDRQFNFDKQKHADMMGMDWARYNQAKAQFDAQYAMNQLSFLQGKAHSEFEQAWQIYTNKDSSTEQKNAAMQTAADALQKQGVPVSTEMVKGLINTATLGLLGTPTRELRVPDKGSASVGTMMAGKPPKNPITGKDDPQYANGLWDYLKKFGIQAAGGMGFYFGGEDK